MSEEIKERLRAKQQQINNNLDEIQKLNDENQLLYRELVDLINHYFETKVSVGGKT